MLQSIKGIWRDGRIELLEAPPAGAGSNVIVTFVADHEIDLAGRGIDPVLAADLRRRLSAFAEDWDRPEMDVYDNL